MQARNERCRFVGLVNEFAYCVKYTTAVIRAYRHIGEDTDIFAYGHRVRSYLQLTCADVADIGLLIRYTVMTRESKERLPNGSPSLEDMQSNLLT